MKLKASLFFVFAALLIGNCFAQDDNIPDWVWKSPMTKVYPMGEYHNLPPAPDQFTYQNPNTTTRVIEKEGQVFVLPPNIRPFPHSNNQSEVDAANMGGNTNVIYASWNSFVPVFSGTGFCLSTNGGSSWTGASVMIPYPTCQGDPGPWVYPTGSTWPGRLGISYIAGAAYSTDNGATWGGHVPYTGGSSFDKNLSAVDDIVGSPFFGRAYTVWTYFSTNRIYISYTTNGGTSWSTGAQVSPVPPGGHHHQGCDVEVGPGGVVYVIWANCLTSGQNSTEDFLGFAKSTNGGVTWTGVTDNAVDINGIRASNLFNGIRANGFPRLAVDHTGGARNGWIYVTLAEKNIAPATDVADITLCRSTNGGTNWTHTKVNQDAAVGRYQYFSDADVAPDGSVCISYYDQRATTGFVTQYWMSRSTDGGNTWADIAVSDHNFTPAPIPGLAPGYQGDYTGITTAAGKVWPFWADNSSGIYQVWTDGITIGGGPPNPLYYQNWCPANTLPVVPTPSLYGACAWLGDTLYYAQGSTDGATASNVVYRYTWGGTWTTGRPLPLAKSIGTLTKVGTKLYFVGGGAPGSNGTTDVYEYDPAAGWTTKAPLPTAKSGHTAHNWGDSVLFIVGGPWGTPNANVYAYRPASNNWISSTSFIGPNRRSHGGGLVGNKILVGGGFPFTNTLVIGTIGANASTIAWAAGPPYPSVPKSRIGGVSIGDRFYLIGGNNQVGTTSSDSTFIYTVSSNSWSALPSIKPTQSHNISNSVAARMFGDTVRVFALCGTSGTTTATNVFHVIGCGPFVGITTTNNEIPELYKLSQNYPNPFNPTTNIKFSLPKSGNVKLVVFDILGKEVTTLVNEFRTAGNYVVDFNASNLASGVYFYKLTAGSFTDTKKMLLVK